MTLLLTGFGPFDDIELNPSQAIVESIAERAGKRGDEGLTIEVLPVEFGAAGDRVRKLIRQVRPRAVVCLGVASRTGAIRLERVALNLDDSEVPDNAGDLARGRLIVPDGPVAYWSTLPLDRMQQALEARGIPAFVSNHAGTYVCNHVFYVSRHEIEMLGGSIPCGFIHVPLMAEQVEAVEAGVPGPPPLATLVEAVECCLAVLRAALDGL